MTSANNIQSIIPQTDSSAKVYELFRSLGYPKDKLLDVEWGEEQGFHERPSCSGRRRWWDLGIWEYADSFWMESINDINRVYINDSKLFESDKFYGVTFRNRENAEYYSLLLNGTLYCLFRELKGFAGMGEGVLKLPVYDVKDIYFLPLQRKKR